MADQDEARENDSVRTRSTDPPRQADGGADGERTTVYVIRGGGYFPSRDIYTSIEEVEAAQRGVPPESYDILAIEARVVTRA